VCWVHAERLVHKLVPANDKQRNAIAVAKRMIWWFYGSLKEYKLAPSPQQAEVLHARFDRIFKRGATGYVMLDRLLRRLFRHKDALPASVSRRGSMAEICVSTPRGLTTTPQSQAITTRSTLTSPFATATSAITCRRSKRNSRGWRRRGLCRLAPVAVLDQHVEHLLEAGAVGKQLAPQCHWVLARRVRHLVDEALDEEHGLGVASARHGPSGTCVFLRIEVTP
jgi:hypothetical protein